MSMKGLVFLSRLGYVFIIRGSQFDLVRSAVVGGEASGGMPNLFHLSEILIN